MYPHDGLFFTQAHVDAAKRYARREPLKTAWEWLRQQPTPDMLTLVLRYRFDGNGQAGSQAVAKVQNYDILLIDNMSQLQTFAQCVELLRDYPGFAIRNSIEMLRKHLTVLNQQPDLPYVEQIWLALLNLLTGIVSDDEVMVTQGVTVFKQIIDQDVRPQGHITPLVEGKDGASMERFLLGIKALILMAEAAQHIGIDLWGYNNRGVSVVTSGLYPLYYYFYPEKWQWDDEITQEETARLFKQHGAYLEILNKHIGRPTKAIDLVLKEIRPAYDTYGGGLLTLSHGVPRRGLFG